MESNLILTMIISLLSPVLTIIGVVSSNIKSNAKMEAKIEMLTEEVKKHNGFAERIPSLETRVDLLTDRVFRLEGK